MPSWDDEYDLSIATAFGLDLKGKRTSQLISLIKEVFNTTYAEVGLDRRYRPFVDALVGMSRGRCDWFECSDGSLAERLFSRERGISRKTLKKRCERDRRKTIEWQLKYQYQVIEVESCKATYKRDRSGEVIYRQDGKPDLYTEVTKYRLPILIRAEELFDAANLRRSPAEYLAQKLSLMLRFVPEESPKPQVDHLAEAMKRVRTGRGFLKSALSHLRQYPASYPKQFIRNLLEDIEKDLFCADDAEEPAEE